MAKRLILVMFFLLIGLVGCSSKPVNLALRLQEGDVFQVNTAIKHQMIQNFQGNEIRMEQRVNIVADYSVKSVTPEAALVDVIYRRYQAYEASSLTGVTLDLDTDNMVDEISAQEVLFARLIGKGFQMKVSPQGTILAITGVEQLIREILQEIKLEDESRRPELEAIVLEIFNEGTLRDQFGGVFMTAVDRPLKKGDIWSMSQTVSTPYLMKLSTAFELLSVNKEQAQVRVFSTISGVPDTPMDYNGIQAIATLSGNMAGTANVYLDSGIAATNALTQTVDGHLLVTLDNEEIVVPVRTFTSIKSTVQKIK